MKHILFFIAQNGFRDEELFEPKQVLEDAGNVCDVTSPGVDLCQGSMGAIVMPTVSLDLLDVHDYDAFVLVGGPGSSEMGNDFRIQDILLEAISQKKLIGAICAAPLILGKMSLLKDVDVTSHSSVEHPLISLGAKIVHSEVHVSSLSSGSVLVTANGPDSAVSFGESLLNELIKKEE